MRQLLLLFLLHACIAPCASSVLEDAYAQNVRLLPSLLGSHSNPEGFPQSTPSLSNPFPFAYVQVLSAHPSASFRISSAKNTSIIWAWGESHAREISQRTQFDARCAEGKTTLTQTGNPHGDFTAAFTLENSPLPSREMRIRESEYFPIPYSQEELDGAQISMHNASLARLFVRISGSISLMYEKREEKNLYKCETTCSKYGCGTSCGCKSEISRSPQPFSREVFAEKAFPLENKRANFLVLSPALLEQLATYGKFSIASFSNRVFASSSLLSSNSQHSATLLSLELAHDPAYGFAYAQEKQSLQSDSNFSFSCSSSPVRMLQLSGENSTLLYSCLSSYNESSPQLGLLNSTLVLNDSFGDSYSFPFYTLSRNYTTHSAALPSQQALYFAGNQTHRPSIELAMLARQRNLEFPSFFQNSWLLLPIFLLLFSLWRFLRP